MSWQDRAACNGTDPEAWFPLKSTHPRIIRALKQICHECPVRAECLNHALEHDEHGIWGGLTDLERRHICGHPPRQLAPCGTGAAFQRHRRRGEECAACREAKNAEARGWREAHPEAAERLAQQRTRARGWPQKRGPVAGVAS